MPIFIRPDQHQEWFLQEKTAATGGIVPSPTFCAIVNSLISKDVTSYQTPWPLVIFFDRPCPQLNESNGISRLASTCLSRAMFASFPPMWLLLHAADVGHRCTTQSDLLL